MPSFTTVSYYRAMARARLDPANQLSALDRASREWEIASMREYQSGVDRAEARSGAIDREQDYLRSLLDPVLANAFANAGLSGNLDDLLYGCAEYAIDHPESED